MNFLCKISDIYIYEKSDRILHEKYLNPVWNLCKLCLKWVRVSAENNYYDKISVKVKYEICVNSVWNQLWNLYSVVHSKQSLNLLRPAVITI